jgi:hypothetical protein
MVDLAWLDHQQLTDVRAKELGISAMNEDEHSKEQLRPLRRDDAHIKPRLRADKKSRGVARKLRLFICPKSQPRWHSS